MTHTIAGMNIEIDLSFLAADMEQMATTLVQVEQGKGADGVGHGKLKPPSEELLEQEEGS
ncbi:MAG: hypothetical protein VKK97_10385 [Synechococcaceae cyanobacterium]|nr:hypothetical protein [Synechococcaceae cyanobacterium]